MEVGVRVWSDMEDWGTNQDSSSMGEPDALACCTDHGSHDMDNQEVVLLSRLVFQIHAMHAMLI